MTSDEDRRAIDRFIAGAPVRSDALANAIAAKAVDRSIVVEALLEGLHDAEPVVRRRTALRIGRMPEADARLAARLTVLAGSDDDAACREASAAALRAHGLAVPGEAAQPARAPRRFARPSLLLRAWAVRSAAGGLEVAARYVEDAPNLDAHLLEASRGEARLELQGLPADFAGTRPVLRARVAPAPRPLTPVGRAAIPVSADGRVTISIPLDDTSFDELADWLTGGVDLVVPDQ